MTTVTTYEYEERAFLDEESFIRVKQKLDKISQSSQVDNKKSYFFVLPNINVSIASGPAKTVVKYKGGQLGAGNGFEEREFEINPESLQDSIRFFSALFGLEPQVSDQFRINYKIDSKTEAALKYTQMWGFHAELEQTYSTSNESEYDIAKQRAKNTVLDIANSLGLQLITDSEMESFKRDCDNGVVRGDYRPDELIAKHGSLFEL